MKVGKGGYRSVKSFAEARVMVGKGPDVRVKVSKGQWVMVGKGLKSHIKKVGKGL